MVEKTPGEQSGFRHTPRCLIIACGAIAKEIVTLRERLGLTDDSMKLQCLPASFHNTPHKIAPAVEEILRAKRSEFDTVLVGYGECGTAGALDLVLEKYSATRLPYAHCYEFFAGSALYENIMETEIGSFFLTDYLVRNFDRLVIKGLGLDRYPHLRDQYFSNYKYVVYLAQTDNAELREAAARAAQRLGLEFVFKYVGYGELSNELDHFVSSRDSQMETHHVQS